MSHPEARTHERLMSEYTALWNGDLSRLDVVADEVRVLHPFAPEGEVHGPAALEAFIGEYHNGFPDFRIEVHDWMERDGLIMKEYTMTGTHEGEFKGISPTDRTIESTGIATIVVEDGEIREDRLYFDRMEPMEQLGVLDV